MATASASMWRRAGSSFWSTMPSCCDVSGSVPPNHHRHCPNGDTHGCFKRACCRPMRAAISIFSYRPSNDDPASYTHGGSPAGARSARTLQALRSNTPQAGEQTVKAAAGRHSDQQQQGAEDELPIFGDPRKRLFAQQINNGAYQRAEGGLHPAEHHHDDEVTRARPGHHRRTDEIAVIGEQRTRESANAAG